MVIYTEMNMHHYTVPEEQMRWAINDNLNTLLPDLYKENMFNGQFTDVFTKSEYSKFTLLDRSAPFMEDIVVTKEGVTKLLKGLNPLKP